MKAESVLQDNCRRLVDNNVYYNISHLISELSGQNKYSDELLDVCINYNNDPFDDCPEEALEHWIISEWLAKRLKAEGEMVIGFMGLTIWGRTTSGQAIYIDAVIEDIYNKHWV